MIGASDRSYKHYAAGAWPMAQALRGSLCVSVSDSLTLVVFVCHDVD